MRNFMGMVVLGVVAAFIYAWFTARNAPDGGVIPPESPNPMEVVLHTGQDTVFVHQGQVHHVGLKAVLDSRCPKGARCIQAGRGTVLLWIQKAKEERISCELSTPDSTSAAAGLLDLILMSLDPHPVSGKVTRSEDYRATLRISARS